MSSISDRTISLRRAPVCAANITIGYGHVVASDINDWGFPCCVEDFLASRRQADCIVTNPPFDLKKQFLTQAKRLARHKIAMLLPYDFECTVAFLNDHADDAEFPLKAVYGLPQAIPWHNVSSTWGRIKHAWFVFERGYSSDVIREYITFSRRGSPRRRNGSLNAKAVVRDTRQAAATFTPDFEAGNVTLYNRDCLDLLPVLPKDAGIITDPPYGVRNNGNYGRFRGGKWKSNNFHDILGDDQPFDPSPWLTFPIVVLWGYPFFAQQLPAGTTLVWQKNRDAVLGKFLSDAELAWLKGGTGTYVFKHIWRGMDRESERGQRTLHPNQKPIALFEWVLELAKLAPPQVVVDPYMGSGPCAVACIKAGIPFIGIELDPRHFETAVNRVKQALEVYRPSKVA